MVDGLRRMDGFYTSMHSGGCELTKLTYTRLEADLIRHRGDRLNNQHSRAACNSENVPGIYHQLFIILLGSIYVLLCSSTEL